MERDFTGYLDPIPRSASKRELEALRYISHGLSREQTADAMCVSESTVKDHLDFARRKLRAKTTAHAVAIALRLGLID